MVNIEKTDKKIIINAFVNEIISLAGVKKCLGLDISEFSVFGIESPKINLVSGLDWQNKIKKGSKYDLILGDLPLGMGREDCEFGTQKFSTRGNWALILSSLQFLKGSGFGIYLVEPMGFGAAEATRLEEALNLGGFFVNAIFNAPEKILIPTTSITPIFVLISQKRTKKVFIAELLNEDQSKQVAQNYFSLPEKSDLSYGMQIQEKSFCGFHRIRINQQMEKLETQYKEFDEYKIEELANEINSVRQGAKHVEKKNSVYIPRIGNSPVISKISDGKNKHHNYFQIVLNKKADNKYVTAFFRSDLGKLVLQSLYSNTFIPHINMHDLEQASVALPSSLDQEEIIKTQSKLYELKTAIDNFDNELALNPSSSNSIFSQLDNMLEAIGGLTDQDKVRNLIRQGESKYIEFKETLSLDVRKNTKEKYITLSVLKTIVGFLNSAGGSLLIGVSDDGKLIGIDKELNKFHKSIDKFLLHFKNMLKERIGEEYYPYIDYKLVKEKGSTVFLVDCNESKSPCYLDKLEFYVRTNPATEKLEGPKMVEYVKHRFNQ